MFFFVTLLLRLIVYTLRSENFALCCAVFSKSYLENIIKSGLVWAKQRIAIYLSIVFVFALDTGALSMYVGVIYKFAHKSLAVRAARRISMDVYVTYNYNGLGYWLESRTSNME